MSALLQQVARLAIAMSLVTPLFAVSTPTSVAITSSANPSILGRAVTLAVTVVPSAATGKVTLYDGTTILETLILANGQATYTTVLLPSGSLSVKAYYGGDASYMPSTSSVLAQYVTAEPENGFRQIALNAAPGTANFQFQVADFNSDGKPDLVFVNVTGPGYIGVLLGNGDGTFQPAEIYSVGAEPTAVAVGDFNGDGKVDVVVGNPSSFQVLLGNGDGTLQPALTYSSLGINAILVSDFNGDGIADLVFAGSYISVLLGNGDGTFQAPINYLGGGINPFDFTVGDFNGDGKPDVAVTWLGPASLYGVQVLLGNGDGTFQPMNVNAPPPNYSSSFLAQGDFNGDGHLDLAVVNLPFNVYNNPTSVAILLGNGDGTFASPVAYPVLYASYMASGDFNGDGLTDLLVANSFYPTGKMSILSGNGNGTFDFSTINAIGSSGLTVADFNGDGATDFTTGESQIQGLTTFGMLLGQPVAVCASPSLSSIAIDANGGQVPLDISVSGSPCAWSATTDSSWISLSPTGGTESATVTATITPNSTGLDQTGNINISISGRLASIVQVNQPFTAEVFTDVPPTTYYFDAVNLLSQLGITTGCGPAIYCPAENVPRDQMAIFIVRSIFGGDNFIASQTPYFADVSATTFGFNWIQKMYELGITAGCGYNLKNELLFCPTSPISRNQLAVFIIRARYGATTTFDFPQTPYFTDVPYGAFAFGWIQRMKEDNITSGCGVAIYCPDNPLTRGDLAIFVMRGLFNRLLPPSEALLVSVNPAVIAQSAQAAVTVSGIGTHFAQGTTVVNPIPGFTIGSVTVINPTTLTVDLTAGNAPTPQPESIWVATRAEEAVLPNAVSVGP